MIAFPSLSCMFTTCTKFPMPFKSGYSIPGGKLADIQICDEPLNYQTPVAGTHLRLTMTHRRTQANFRTIQECLPLQRCPTLSIYSIPETWERERQRGKRPRNTAVTRRRSRQNKKSSALTLLAKKQINKQTKNLGADLCSTKRGRGHTDGFVEECLIH